MNILKERNGAQEKMPVLSLKKVEDNVVIRIISGVTSPLNVNQMVLTVLHLNTAHMTQQCYFPMIDAVMKAKAYSGAKAD